MASVWVAAAGAMSAPYSRLSSQKRRFGNTFVGAWLPGCLAPMGMWPRGALPFAQRLAPEGFSPRQQRPRASEASAVSPHCRGEAGLPTGSRLF